MSSLLRIGLWAMITSPTWSEIRGVKPGGTPSLSGARRKRSRMSSAQSAASLDDEKVATTASPHVLRWVDLKAAILSASRGKAFSRYETIWGGERPLHPAR